MSTISRRSFVQGGAPAAAAAAASAAVAAPALAQETAASPLADGVYTAVAKGFIGDVTVTVEASGGAVSAVSTEAPRDTPDRGGKAAEQLSGDIATAGGTQRVDVVAGATVTSKAVIQAAEDCLAQARAPAEVSPVAMKPGIYVGEGNGFNWFEPVRVKIEVSESNLLSVEVIEKGLNREEPLILKAAEGLLIPRMVEHQSVAVDSITGATSSSAGIKAATEDALKKALAAAGTDPTAIKNFYATPVYTEVAEETVDVDVVVCGMGGAGCETKACDQAAWTKYTTMGARATIRNVRTARRARWPSASSPRDQPGSDGLTYSRVQRLVYRQTSVAAIASPTQMPARVVFMDLGEDSPATTAPRLRYCPRGYIKRPGSDLAMANTG